MKKISFSKLLNKELNVMQKKFFFIPAAIALIGIVLLIVFHFTLGSALNLGIDFAGGYSMDVKFASKLSDAEYETYKNKAITIIENLNDENGNHYNLKVSNVQHQQSTATASVQSSSIHILYKAIASESAMIDEVNPDIENALREGIFKIIPTVSINNNVITIVYSEVRTDQDFIGDEEKLNDAISFVNTEYNAGIANAQITHNSENKKEITINCASIAKTDSEVVAAFVDAMTVDARFIGDVTAGTSVGATIGRELLFNAFLAIALALVFMLCYIGVRFQFSSGLAAICMLIHDAMMMFLFMIIFHIEINATFIAAVITILGYSINNTIIIFDRVREISGLKLNKNMSYEQIANKAVNETMLRSINTTITTLIMIGMVAIIGVAEIKIFALPIIAGLLFGFLSSVFLAPNLWVVFQKLTDKISHKKKNKSEQKTVTNNKNF